VAMLLVPSVGFNMSAGQESEPAERQTAGAAAEIKGKDEVVYATLSAAGAVDAIYIVNHFDLDKAGSIKDYGDYSSVVNLTDTGRISQDGDEVSFTAEADNYYYQGNMTSKDLPWDFDITYHIDGRQVEPQEAAGRSGRLEIKISSAKATGINPVFYDNYMLQITVTLDTETCGNIDAPDGTPASAGKDKVITYTVLPGKDADYSLSADVRDFTMAGISVAAMPYSMDIDFPDTDDKLGDLEKLPEAISELNDGVSELEDGIVDMESGADSLTSGSAGIRDGLAQLSGNSVNITNASAQINGALAQISAALSGSPVGSMDLSQIQQLPQGLAQLSEGLSGVSGGLTQLKEGFAPAYAALDSAIQGIPEPTVTEEQIQALYGTVMAADPNQQATVDGLVAGYTAAQTVKGTYAQVKAGFDAVGTTIDTLVGSIGQMSEQLDASVQALGGSLQNLDSLGQLNQLIAGISELSANYSAFHSGLVEYTNGVDTLASNYNAFHSGIASFGEGVGELGSGIGELYDGTKTLNDEVSDMPEMIQDEIDGMKDEYMPADFDPVSFASEKNTDTGFVQFVLQFDGIEKPEAPEEPEVDEETNETFWDRLAALFQ